MSIAGSTPSATSKAPQEARPKRFLSNTIGSLFNAKGPHVNTFAIELEEKGLRTYGPGDVVSGTVVLDVARPLGVTHVTVSLSGFVDVFKNHRSRAKAPNEAEHNKRNRGNRWTSEYYGDGFASLFEQEVVICGEGRLDPKTYHFQFEIAFPSQLSLPSSIEFERGQISYNVETTLTKTGTMASPSRTSRKLNFSQNVDIASLGPPKPHEATLKVVKRQGASASRTTLRRLRSGDARSARSSTLASLESSEPRRESATSGDTSLLSNPESQHSSSSRNTESVVSLPHSIRTTPSLHADTASTSSDGPHISAELSRSGCLPGQNFNVIVKIDNQTKPVQSVRGIVATLYREGRTDFQPNLPLRGEAERRAKYEDYYPRSKTGIGGMSMDNAGSDKRFKQDICQTTKPLIIQQPSMSAEVRIPMRVPDDAIQTIKGVPGNMISFRYYVEVIVDVQGKMPLQEKFFASSTSAPPSMTTTSIDAIVNADSVGNQPTVWGSSCIDTGPLKHHKHAVRLQCELVIGTRDSSKAQGKRRAYTGEQAAQAGSDEAQYSPNGARRRQDLPNRYEPANDRWSGAPAYWHAYGNGGQGPDYDQHYGNGHYEGYYEEGYEYDEEDYLYDYDPTWYGPQHGSWHRPPPVEAADRPPDARNALVSGVPLPPDRQAMSEKQIMAEHEASLLPSEPPGAEEANPSGLTPSAPVLPEHQDSQHLPPAPPWYHNASHPLRNTEAYSMSAPAPAYVDRRGPNHESHSREIAEDKQELERRRLAEAATSPEDPQGGEVSGATGASVPSEQAISADDLALENRTAAEDTSVSRGPTSADTAQMPPAEPHQGEALPRYEQ